VTCSQHNYGRITLDDTKQHLITIAKFSNKEAVGQSGKFCQMVKINLGFKCETSSPFIHTATKNMQV